MMLWVQMVALECSRTSVLVSFVSHEHTHHVLAMFISMYVRTYMVLLCLCMHVAIYMHVHCVLLWSFNSHFAVPWT